MNRNEKFCYNCGQKLPLIAKYCIACGTKQDIMPNVTNKDNTDSTVEAPSGVAVYEVRERKSKVKIDIKSIFSMITKSLGLLLSVILIWFAFLPSVQVEYDKVELSVTPVKTIVFFFDSLVDKTEEELQDSKTYEKFEELTEKISDIDVEKYEELSPKEKKLVDEFFYYTIRIMLQHEDVPLTLDLIISGVMAFLFLCFVVAFFTISLLNFLGIFVEKLRNLTPIYYILLSIIPALTIFAYYCMSLFMGDTYPVSMGSGLVLTLIFSSVVVVYEFVIGLVLKLNSFQIKDIILTSIKLVLTVVVMCLAFSSFYATTIETKFKDSTKNSEVTIYKGASSFFNFEYIESQEKEYKEFASLTADETTERFKFMFSSFSSFKLSEVKEGKANLINDACLIFAYATVEFYKYSVVFVLVPVFVLFGLLLAGVVMQQIMFYLITGKKNKLLVTLSSIGQFVANAIALALTITSIVLLVQGSFVYFAPKGYELKIAAGVIILVIFSIGLLCFPQYKDNEELTLIEE